MRIRRLLLENWKNFRSVDVELPARAFLVGPNASGKSNLLDAIRFLGDVARPGAGGLQAAVGSERRQGMSQIRSLHARTKSDVVIEIEVGTETAEWRYRLEMNADKKAARVVREVVHRDGKVLLTRPLPNDVDDPALLAQTHLEQLSANANFRPLAEFLARITYLHLVPQLLRDPQRFELVGGDPLGSDFLRRVANVPKKTRDARLRTICRAMRVAVPSLEQLQVDNDKSGVPHLRGQFKHWRPNAGWQDERQFSDGTLRLVALLWILTDDQAPLLLEEPELSLNAAVVREIPRLLHRAMQTRPRQILVSTHSADLLADRGIALEEILMVVPAAEGSRVVPAAGRKDIQVLLDEGLDPGAAVLPLTAPSGMQQRKLPFPA
ncbi:MAG: AAA family ATPase [Planctomycetes bacterium]|jgi:predicted ATPase|nr:AAA family ATPase [Planctomycetota bacterium]